MNYRGSYRNLVKNSKSAMLAAIEIYNKPHFEYRDECCVILLLNAWELILKALLSKHKLSIFYKKQRKEPYRTLSWADALARAEAVFPKPLPSSAIRSNLALLATFRDNSVHFYNESKFGVVLYALSQTAIVNYRDLLNHAFGITLEDEMNWQLLPLGMRAPVDPVEFIAGVREPGEEDSPAVRQFLRELASSLAEAESAGVDTGRLLTIFRVKLESTKKVQNADVVVGVAKSGEATPLTVVKPVDPNVSHPLRQKEVLQRLKDAHQTAMSPHTLQAILWHLKLKERTEYCWRASEGVLTRYSHDLVALVASLPQHAVQDALAAYRAYLRAATIKKSA